MESLILPWFIVWVAFAIIVGVAANTRGRNGGGWLIPIVSGALIAVSLNSSIASAQTVGVNELAFTHLTNGAALARKGDYGAAIAEYDRAIELSPHSSQAFFARANAYRLRAAHGGSRNEYDRALADVNEAIRLDPKNASALSLRGALYSANGDHDKALADMNVAINLSPSALNYNNRGFVYNNKGDYDLAISDLNEAIRLDSTIAHAYKNRGISFEKKNELHKALSEYETAVQLNPKLQEAIDGARRVNQLLAESSRSQQIVQVQQMPTSSEPPPRIAGADLFIDLAQYIGRPVILTDGTVFGANNSNAAVRTRGPTFQITVEGIDRESFRFFLKNCSAGNQDNCKMPLLVTPTGEKSGAWPSLKNVKMIQ
jgi:tetratricopeptide (TPR) repeat protein